jgi:ergothioneine biosynthesis protein EgtB
MSVAAPASTAARLLEAWERSDRILGCVAVDALLARPIRLRQPFLFYVGHLPAFAWNHLWRGVLGRSAFAARLDALFERGIDPPDDAQAPVDDPSIWPPAADVLAYRDRVREALPAVLEAPEARQTVEMVLEHELMHHETLLYMIHELEAGAKVRPAELPPGIEGRAPQRERISVPAGRATLGAPRDDQFRWDNEHPERLTDVPAFAIDSTPVTNRELLGFVEAGGYEERRLWSEDAWRWLGRNGIARPHFFRKDEEGWRVRTLFDEVPFAEAADWPAFATQCEAAAFTRWLGGRLPTEPEFHRAAYGAPDGPPREHPWGDAPPDSSHGNLGFLHWGPTPVGSHPAGASAFGVHELVGNGWEWTGTTFAPFPGFEPLPRYPGYSADFFDGRHFVMLGGSWATDRRLLRRSFRNWFRPHYPYVFAKFRCVFPP